MYSGAGDFDSSSTPFNTHERLTDASTDRALDTDGQLGQHHKQQTEHNPPNAKEGGAYRGERRQPIGRPLTFYISTLGALRHEFP